MKQILEDTIEQLTAKPQGPKPTPKPTTSGLKEAFDPGKLMADAMKQALGFGGEKKIPTKEELEQKTKEDSQKTEVEINQIKEGLGFETSQGGQPQQVHKQPVKGNVAVINPPKTVPPPPPAYISGKPGLQTSEERALEEEKKKKELPALPVISTKPRRGSWLSSMERKKHGTEIKGGRE